jgi:hypothetical protein
MRAALGLVMAACIASGMFWQAVQARPLEACEEGQVSQDSECVDQDHVMQPSEEGEALSAFPSGSCRSGYYQQGSRLCMTAARGPRTFPEAMFDCKVNFGRVADYSDWYYRYWRGDGIRAPYGWWLGPITADDRALYVNNPNTTEQVNFEGEAPRNDSRYYACAHDDIE